MRRQVTITGFPFNGRIRTSHAIPTGRILRISTAAAALLYDLMANPAVERTSFRRHERAFKALFDRCTNHWNHLLSLILQKKAGHKNPGSSRQEKTSGI